MCSKIVEKGRGREGEGKGVCLRVVSGVHCLYNVLHVPEGFCSSVVRDHTRHSVTDTVRIRVHLWPEQLDGTSSMVTGERP